MRYRSSSAIGIVILTLNNGVQLKFLSRNILFDSEDQRPQSYIINQQAILIAQRFQVVFPQSLESRYLRIYHERWSVLIWRWCVLCLLNT